MKNIILLSFIAIQSLLIAQEFGSLQGNITGDANMEPQIGIKTIIIQRDTTPTSWKVVAGVLSDLDGNYKLTNIPPGTYSICFVGLHQKDTVHNVVIIGGKTEILNHHFNTPALLEVQEINVVACRIQGMTAVNPSGLKRKTAPNRENYSKIDEHTFVSVSSDPLSTFSIDVDRAAYSNVRRFIHDGQLPPPDAVRIEEMLNYFPYNYPTPSGKDPVSITTNYTACPWNDRHHLFHVGLKAKDIDLRSAPPNNLVFLIDVSGSMSDANKLPLLKKGLYLLVDQLREQDQVSIVVYAGAAGLVLPTTKGNAKQTIKSVIERLDAGGSTAGGEGIELAYQTAMQSFIANGNNRVILATDGDFNVGISSEGELIRLIESKRDQGVFLSVLGFGIGNLQDAKLEKLADRGNGNYSYIDNELEAKKVLVDEMGGTLVTVAKDVKLQVEFNPTHVKAYRLIGYENRDLKDEDFNNDAKDAGDMGAGHSVTALYEIIPAHSDETIPGIDSLRYQQKKEVKTNPQTMNELLTVKLRYKQPNGAQSQLLTRHVDNDIKPFENAPEDLRFACAVIEFGMLLRNSEFKGNAHIQHAMESAQQCLAYDPEHYRKDFIELVRMAAPLLPKQ
jgi:Ca-activated chloride channel family protein